MGSVLDQCHAGRGGDIREAGGRRCWRSDGWTLELMDWTTLAFLTVLNRVRILECLRVMVESGEFTKLDINDHIDVLRLDKLRTHFQ